MNEEDLYYKTPNPGVKISRSSHLLGSKKIILKGGINNTSTTIEPAAVIRGDLCSSDSNDAVVLGRGVSVGKGTVIKPGYHFEKNKGGDVVLIPGQVQIGQGTTIGRHSVLDGVKYIGMNVNIGEGECSLHHKNRRRSTPSFCVNDIYH